MFRRKRSFELTPKLSFAISMLYLASSDGTMNKEEIRYISAIMHSDIGVLNKANQYIKYAMQKNISFYHFLEESNKILSFEQKECIILNLIDLMFLDEDMSPYEEKLLNIIIKEYSFPNDDYLKYKKLMYIKNHHTIFDKK